MYNCMFVSALPDPTCNSEKSANGGNKQILLLLLLLLIQQLKVKCAFILDLNLFKSKCKISGSFTGLNSGGQRIANLLFGKNSSARTDFCKHSLI